MFPAAGRPNCYKLLVILLAVQAPAAWGQQRGARTGPAHVGVVLDGPSPNTAAWRSEFEREILAFFGDNGQVDFPDELRLEGDWTPAGATAALDRLLAPGGADIVLALGPIASDELAHRREVPKPAIAALIIDASVQQLPAVRGASGVRNLAYVDIAYTTSRTLEVFHDVVPYRDLAVMVHPGLVAAIPQLRTRIEEQAAKLGVTIQVVPVVASAADALNAIPAGTDAVYLAALEQLPPSGRDSLLAGLNARRLPTFSAIGAADVQQGALVSYVPPDDAARRARRVAGLMRRILDEIGRASCRERV